MTRKELVRAVAARTGVPQADADQVVGAVFGAMRDALCAGRRVEIRGFGTWHPRQYPERSGRNPRTGATVTVEAKVLPVFRIGKALRERVQARADNSCPCEPPRANTEE